MNLENSVTFRGRIQSWIWVMAFLFPFLAGTGNDLSYGQQIAQVQRQSQPDTSWQIGPYVQGGFLPPNYPYPFAQGQNMNLSLDFYSAGIVLGKEIRRIHAPLRLTGRAEALLEITPFWLAQYPAQKVMVQFDTPYKISTQNYYGSSVTPFLLRWNFSESNRQRVVPWLQLGGGLLWTDHKFPELFYPIPLPSNNTSVINFTPQVGAGVNLFRNARQSADLAVKFIHISSAGLGDTNPGLDYTIQFAAGYSWWK